MFHFFKKSSEPEKWEIVAPADGTMFAIEDVKDAVFSQKVLGDGVAFRYEGDSVTICAPADGTLSAVFPTGHAFGITMENGVELLIHIGIDTVNLQGKYFTAHVKDGDTVKAGQPLVTFELDQVKKAGYDTVIPLVFTDPDHQINVSSLKMRRVTHGDRV